jgi:hypothetical protein
MRNVVSTLVAALVIAGCGGTESTAQPNTQAPASLAPATASPAAPTTAAVLPLHDGPLQAGTYSFLGGFGTVDVPSGWEGCCGAFAILKSDYSALLIEDITEVIVYADSCKWEATSNPEPKGAQATAAAFSAQVGHQGTEPEAITVGGMPGWRVTLTVPADQPVTGSEDARTFTGCDDGQFASWGLKDGSGEPSRYHQGPSQIDTLHIVDVGNRTIVFDMVSGPDISDSDKAELDAMLASVEFD